MAAVVMTKILPVVSRREHPCLDEGYQFIWETLLEKGVSGLREKCVIMVCVVTPTIPYITKGLMPNLESVNGRKCHFSCTWSCGWNLSENQKIQGNLKTTRCLWLKD
jgi:hypothetical protein